LKTLIIKKENSKHSISFTPVFFSGEKEEKPCVEIRNGGCDAKFINVPIKKRGK
jgi:hypothetical protein